MSPLSLVLAAARGTVLAALLSLVPQQAFAAPEQIDQAGRGIARISDPHGWLRHEERAALEQRLGKFWAKTGLKISILVDSPASSWESLDAFAGRTASQWGLVGNGARHGGVLMVVDPHQRQAALRISSELAADFPSGEIGRIINGNVNPLLLRGELVAGITEGIKRIAAVLEQPNRANRSLFAQGYGIVASFGLFLAGMLLRRKWGALRSAVATGASFGALVCIDGFTLGFPWYGVLFCAVLAALFLGLFVWVGLGNDASADAAK